MRREQPNWMAPIVGTLKCNVDGCFFNDDRRFGFGMCLRDHMGHTAWLSPKLPIHKGEALGLLHAL